MENVLEFTDNESFENSANSWDKVIKRFCSFIFA